MRVFLETQRLMLRRFTMADADDLVSLDADPDVMRFVTGGVPTSRDEIENEVLPAFLGYYERYEGFGFWAAVEKATGVLMGWFHFRPRRDAVPARSSWLPAAQAGLGQGVCHRGSCALICKGFTEFGVQRVVAGGDGGQCRLAAGDGEGGPEAGADLPPARPYPIEGDQFGDVEHALDKAGWQQHQPAASDRPSA